MSVKHLYLIAAAALLGCAPTTTTTSTGATQAPRRASLLTAEEIGDAHASAGTTYDAVSRLRPQWLSSHGPTSFTTPGTEYAIVFVDGHRYGDLGSLRNIPASDVADIRYFNSSEAGGRFGLKAGTGGVIEVRMNLSVSPSPPSN